MNTQQELPPDDSDEINDQLEFIQEANDLRVVNDTLTRAMAEKKIHTLIKDEKLVIIRDAILDLALIGDGDEDENRLIAAATLGRLSAVVRRHDRKEALFSRLQEIFDAEPPDIEKLADGDEKYYASLSFSAVHAPWVTAYCNNQSALIDTAEKARYELFHIVLRASGNLSNFWQQNVSSLAYLNGIESNDMRYKRIRRISRTMNDVVKNWEGEVGVDAGLALSNWLAMILRSNKQGVDEDILAEILDDSLGMLLRVIDLRFSNALLAPTYAMLGKAKITFGKSLWSQIMRRSKKLEKVRDCLKEAALVLARQDRTDKDLMDMLCSAYYSRAQVMPAITAHFSIAREIDPETRAWWEKGGVVGESHRAVEHKVGNSEDRQIGSLLINVEESKTVMDKLSRAVVPFLEISDPPLAETVKKVVRNYTEITQATKQLAAMRKLSRMELKGEVVEYDPLQHEMLGGHQLGFRQVKVERDGIKKDFGGKSKVLVKPRVSPKA